MGAVTGLKHCLSADESIHVAFMVSAQQCIKETFVHMMREVWEGWEAGGGGLDPTSLMHS